MKPNKSSLPFAELALSICAGLLLMLTSLVGVLAPGQAYPTPEQQASLVPNDIVNLLLGLPFLAVMIWQAQRGRLWARLCWPGALLYIVYNSLISVINLFPAFFSLAHLVQLALCAATLWFMAARLNREALGRKIAGGKWEIAAGWVLTVMGAIFLARAAALIFSAPDAAYFKSVEFAVTLTDLIFSPLWIFLGIALLRGKVFGNVGTAACLSQLIALYAGLMLVMLIQPMMSGAALVIGDFLVIAVMSLVVIIPGLLFIAGLEKRLPGEIFR
jgi:hypothetical protein